MINFIIKHGKSARQSLTNVLAPLKSIFTYFIFCSYHKFFEFFEFFGTKSVNFWGFDANRIYNLAFSPMELDVKRCLVFAANLPSCIEELFLLTENCYRPMVIWPFIFEIFGTDK